MTFQRNQKQESNFQQIDGLVTRDSFAFCLYRAALYFKGMPNSINLYKRIFLHVIRARIIVPCLNLFQWWHREITFDLYKDIYVYTKNVDL